MLVILIFNHGNDCQVMTVLRLDLKKLVRRFKGLVKSSSNFQALEWLCLSFICVRIFVTQWTVDHQAPLSMGFSRQKYWSGWPFSSPGDFPNPVTEPRSPALQANSLLSQPPGKPIRIIIYSKINFVKESHLLELHYTNFTLVYGHTLNEYWRTEWLVILSSALFRTRLFSGVYIICSQI